MPTRQPIRKSAVIWRGLGSPIRAKRSPGDGQRARIVARIVGGAIPWNCLKFLPFRQFFRPLALLEKSPHGQGVDEGKDDNSIRDSALLRSHLRARRNAHVVEERAHDPFFASAIVTPKRSQSLMNSACNSCGVISA